MLGVILGHLLDPDQFLKKTQTKASWENANPVIHFLFFFLVRMRLNGFQ